MNKVRQGSIINFYGTTYTVDKAEGDLVKVTMDNGIPKTLWWTDREGCTLIKY